MKKNCQIAIYTRFNVPIKFDGIKNRPNIHLDENWLDGRVELFHNFCLPSVKGQTIKNFTWFMCFSKNTPQKYIDSICTIEQIVPILAGSQTQAVEYSQEYLLKEGSLITMRLDSDDSISLDYLEKVLNFSQSISHDETYALAFSDGCELDITNKKYYTRLYLHNQFLALCQKVSLGKVPEGIFETAHFSMHRKHKTLLVPTEEPMWRINIHEDNVANTVKGALVERDFGYLFGQ